MTRLKVINRSVNPLLVDLPDWVDAIQPHQITAIQEIMAAFESCDVVVLEAPTGSGKTLIAEVVRRLLQRRASYICSSKSLQQQFLTDYEYAKLLMGRANYPTQLAAEHFHPDDWMNHVSCEECTWTLDAGCRWCVAKQHCPYDIAKTNALAADIAVLNTSYFLAEANGPGRFSNRPFVIVDEADTLEAALMNHVSVAVGERRLNQWGWTVPEKVTVKSSYEEWLNESITDLALIRRRVPGGDEPRFIRERNMLDNLISRMRAIRSGLDSDAWVYTGRSRKDKPGKGAAFKPSRVDFLGEEMLWRHGDKWLLMSATIISAQELLDSLGCDRSYGLVRVANTFPVENRRVVVMPVADMSAKNKATSYPVVANAIRALVAKHANERVLIHSVSYELTEHLRAALSGSGRPILSYKTSSEREGILAAYKATERAVLIAPSFERGIDLPGDLCRVQIIAKVPYPYLGDRQVSVRLHSRGGQVWYNVQAIRELVQMCGRAVRGKDDWATTYVIDSSFKSGLWNRGRGLFPSWFVDGLVWQ